MLGGWKQALDLYDREILMLERRMSTCSQPLGRREQEMAA